MSPDQPTATGRTLLVVTRFPPLPGSSGAGTYLFSILEYLHRQGMKIVVCWSERPASAHRRGWYLVDEPFDRVATLLFPGAICLGRLRIFPSVFLNPIRDAIRRTLKPVAHALGIKRPRPATAEETGPPQTTVHAPYAWDRPPDPYEQEFFPRCIAKYQPDALLYNYCWMTPIVECLPDPSAYLHIALTSDVRHLYSTLVDGRIHWSEGDYMSKQVEMDYLRRADVVIAIREDDADVFRQSLPGKEVVVSYPSLDPVPPTRASLPHRCLFVAAENEANREGILWFLEKVWPLVRTADPEAHLHICGTICKAIGTVPEGVRLLGFVPSLMAEYDEAALAIVPLLRGSGVKIKLLEALSHGKPCVSTPIGTEGMPFLDHCVKTAGSADAFAAHVLHLLADEAERATLQERSLRAVAECLSPTACYSTLLEQIQHFKPPGRP